MEMITFKLRPLYPEKELRYLFPIALGGLQSQSGSFERREKHLTLTGIPTPVCPVHSLVAIQTTLIWLQIIVRQLNYYLRYGVNKHFTLSSVQESHIPNLHRQI